MGAALSSKYRRNAWALSVVCCLSILLFLIICFSSFKSNEGFHIDISSKSLTLSYRNKQRWIRLYEKYNILVNLTNFRMNTNLNKRMIYVCRSNCGGWGDRLRGILSVYTLSLLTNRHFMIDMPYPCDITTVLQPNFVNWTYIRHSKTVNRTHLYIRAVSTWTTPSIKEIDDTIGSKDFAELWSSYDDIFITTDGFYMTLALGNRYMVNKTQNLLGRIPISEATMEKLFPLLFELLFKPSTSVEKHVNTVLSATYHRRLICLHTRIGKNPTLPSDEAFTARVNMTKAMLEFTDNYLLNGSSSIVFITSDSSKAVSDVLHHYPNNSITTVGPILHIDLFDRQTSNVCEGFTKVVSDFYILGECQTSLISVSGFSFWASLRREKLDEELYFYNETMHKIRKVNLSFIGAGDWLLNKIVEGVEMRVKVRVKVRGKGKG